MKLSYAFVVVALVTLTSRAKAGMREDLRAISKSCQDEVHITEEELQKFFKNGKKPEDATDAVKCHVKCMMGKSGLMKDGQFDDKAFMERAKNAPFLKDHLDAVAKSSAACSEVKGDNDCDTAFKIAMCFKANKDAAGVPSMFGSK